MPQSTAPGDEWGEGDFNAGLTVDDNDLSLLLANWGAGCSSAGEAIPEPASAEVGLTPFSTQFTPKL